MKDFSPLNKKTEIFRWGPIPGRYIYVSEFNKAIFEGFPALYKVKSNERWPKTLFLFKDKRMVWLNEFPALRAAGRNLFVNYMLPSDGRERIKKDWFKKVKILNDFEDSLREKNLKKLSNEELYELGTNFEKLIIDFWIPTVFFELGNYGSDKLLEEKLNNFTSNESELSSVMEVLTAPEAVSFYQQEEIDLAKTNNLEEHYKKYFWLKNSYGGPEKLSIDFFVKRKKEINPDIEKLIAERIKKIRGRKKEIILRHKLPNEIIDIAKILCEGMALQDDRKRNIFIFIYYRELLLEEISRRFGYPIDGLRNCNCGEVMAVVKGENLRPIIEKRSNVFGFFINNGVENLLGEKASYCWDEYAQEQVRGDVKEIKGTVASFGKDKIVTGKARIILDVKENKVFENGDILIAPMTSPEYIFLMKKAKAIITDAGGLTSHAAIVSRELGVPCIIGTKIATKVLKDGDLVEVDTNKRTVKILKK